MACHLCGACRGGHGGPEDQQLRCIRDRRDVHDRPIARVGRQPLNRITDASTDQGRADGGEHRGQLLEVVGLLGQLGGDHDLLTGGGGLGVVALQGSAVAMHEAAVGVGGVDRRLGIGSLIAPPRPDMGSGPLAAGPGGGSQLLDPPLVALLTGGSLGLQQRLGLVQPGQPLGPANQGSRQRITAGAALAVLGLVDGRCLLEQLGDFRDWTSSPARACSWRTRNRAMVT